MNAIGLGNSLMFVENVMSSAYRVYRQPCAFAIWFNLVSNMPAIRFEIIGEHGLPWGSSLLCIAICARIVAVLGFSRKFLSLMKKPRTLPKFREGKKFSWSMLRTYLLRECGEALEKIDRFFANPCDTCRFCSFDFPISATHSVSRLCSRCWRPFSFSFGAWIVRVPPDHFGMSNCLYRLPLGVTYKR